MDTTATELPQVRTRPTPEQKRQCREAYIKGKGSLRLLSQQLNLSFGTVQDWSDAENWPELRRTFEQAMLDKLLMVTKPAATVAPIEPPEATTKEGKLHSVEAQLKRVDDLLKDASAKELNGLTQAKERLLKAWALLSGFPSPGVRKQTRQRQPIQDIQPIPAMIEPVPVVPSKPLGWEYD